MYREYQVTRRTNSLEIRPAPERRPRDDVQEYPSIGHPRRTDHRAVIENRPFDPTVRIEAHTW